MKQQKQHQNQKPPTPESVAPDSAPAAAESESTVNIAQADLAKLTAFSDYLERINLAEYVRLTQRPRRLISLNFISGVARGFGMAVGFTLLGALGIYILNQLNLLNLPVIGEFIAKLLEYVDLSRGMKI